MGKQSFRWPSPPLPQRTKTANGITAPASNETFGRNILVSTVMLERVKYPSTAFGGMAPSCLPQVAVHGIEAADESRPVVRPVQKLKNV